MRTKVSLYLAMIPTGGRTCDRKAADLWTFHADQGIRVIMTLHYVQNRSKVSDNDNCTL